MRNSGLVAWLAIAIVIFVFIFSIFYFQDVHNGQQMKDCVATGNHSWVQKRGDYYECIPDSQVSR
jgi:hypothetical protein